ncbi:MAG: alpha/beta hydrolase [Deltaproteobacteria bacterium]|nr:alpha/beta hydrolase [Deltaproteobacteria bacterium]
MPLHPQVKTVLDLMTKAGPPMHHLTPEKAREQILAMRANKGDVEPVGKVEDRTIKGPAGDIPIRIYTPNGRGPFPLLVYFHGGGWVVGSIETVDASCRSLTNQAGCITVSVDYRLAPEHKFPAAPEDCYAATTWTALNASSIHGDPSRLAIGGESAGANLAAAVALMAQERGAPSIALQLLLYPVTDYACNTPSCRENGEGYFLTTEMMRWFWNHYLRNSADGENPLASPLRAKRLQSLAPAAIFTAEFDPLRDEGADYARKLRDAGIPVEYKCQEGLIHGYMGMAKVVEPAEKAVQDAASSLRNALAK